MDGSNSLMFVRAAGDAAIAVARMKHNLTMFLGLDTRNLISGTCPDGCNGARLAVDWQAVRTLARLRAIQRFGINPFSVQKL